MSQRSKREYLSRIHGRYQRAGREHKRKILDEFCEICDYHRKYALRLLNRPLRERAGRPGPKPKYTLEVVGPLKELWLATDQMCSKRLKAAMPIWLEYRPEWSAELKQQLEGMSAATIDRLLKAFRAGITARRRWTKPGSLIKQAIPIRVSNEDIDRPGYLEVDTVAHCGGSLEGDFAWSATFTDIVTGWTEVRSVWNRSAESIRCQVEQLRQQLPFELLGFDSDNGGEFINHGLYRCLGKYKVKFTRSRPSHKNDNAHVEQKNWTHVRQLFGYDRFEHPELVDKMNQLCAGAWGQFQNFFCPNLKLQSKERIGGKVRKRYAAAQTPYERVLASEQVNPDKKAQLRAQREKLNPFVLRQQIEQCLKEFFGLKRKLEAQKNKSEGPLYPDQFIALEPTLSSTQNRRSGGTKPARAVELTQRTARTRRSGCAAAEPYPPSLRNHPTVDTGPKKVLKSAQLPMITG